jgi:hypothetical protein
VTKQSHVKLDALHRVTDEHEQAAREWLRRHDERSYSFVERRCLAPPIA